MAEQLRNKAGCLVRRTVMTTTKADSEFMSIALELAREAQDPADSCALVGAVVVENGETVGTGYHAYEHAPHAESIALAEAGEKAHGSTLYTTLEPCTSSLQVELGRLDKSCTQLIKESGVARVVIAMKDPNPLVNGRGIEELRANGIEAIVGVGERKARELNCNYIRYIESSKSHLIAERGRDD
jgi:diaminohydroxyphosphoribosylaminopyrimidine deaminase/5-amino-6-(5-phosphoribosylamino)uracil reductase